MKMLATIDLNGTPAESKLPPDPKTAALRVQLFEFVKVAVNSAGAWAKFKKTILGHPPHDERPGSLALSRSGDRL